MAKRKRTAKSSTKPFWFFSTTDHGETQGFSDEQLQYFEGNHEWFIAREAIQNAIDARFSNDEPVVMVFEELFLPTANLPGHKELFDVVRRCQTFSANEERAIPFFQEATKLLKGERLSVLKISDYNTKGLSGSDDDEKGNWFRLVRAAGMSSMKGAGGGSFGIGKGAPFAASALHTVFYSSINENGDPVFQGKARLTSHKNAQKDIRQRTGFFGIDGYKAIRDARRIPSFFQRQKVGTDIYIVGYKGPVDWQERLIKSILENFWLAIHHGDLEVLVKSSSGEKFVNKENLKDELAIFASENAKAYFEAATNPERTFEQDLKHLGKCSLFIRKKDGYPRKIMMSRKPKMVVQEKTNHVLREHYAGVFICEDGKGNALLRDLEPPTHDKWDKERAELGNVAIREIDDFLKQSLKSMSGEMPIEPQDIPGLDKYLPDSDDVGTSYEEGMDVAEDDAAFSPDETAQEVGMIKPPQAFDLEKVVRKATVSHKEPGKIAIGKNRGGGGGEGGGAAGDQEGDKDGMRINTSRINFRSFVQKAKGELEYHFAISCREDCEGSIKIVAIGDDTTYPADIISARDIDTGKDYSFEESFIEGLVINQNKPVRLAVKLASRKKYVLGIENYEN